MLTWLLFQINPHINAILILGTERCGHSVVLFCKIISEYHTKNGNISTSITRYFYSAHLCGYKSQQIKVYLTNTLMCKSR
jgi:hypothetical protein